MERWATFTHARTSAVCRQPGRTRRSLQVGFSWGLPRLAHSGLRVRKNFPMALFQSADHEAPTTLVSFSKLGWHQICIFKKVHRWFCCSSRCEPHFGNQSFRTSNQSPSLERPQEGNMKRFSTVLGLLRGSTLHSQSLPTHRPHTHPTRAPYTPHSTLFHTHTAQAIPHRSPTCTLLHHTPQATRHAHATNIQEPIHCSPEPEPWQGPVICDSRQAKLAAHASEAARQRRAFAGWLALHVFVTGGKLRHCRTLVMAVQKGEGLWLLFLYQLCCERTAFLSAEIY